MQEYERSRGDELELILIQRNLKMPYSQFICGGCGKYREMLGSKVVYIAGKKSRVCESCKKVRERSAKKEAANGSNG